MASATISSTESTFRDKNVPWHGTKKGKEDHCNITFLGTHPTPYDAGAYDLGDASAFATGRLLTSTLFPRFCAMFSMQRMLWVPARVDWLPTDKWGS